MRVGFLGTGSWGYCLAWVLASKGIKTLSWSIMPQEIEGIRSLGAHPRHPYAKTSPTMEFTLELEDLLQCDMIVEAVTAAGLRPTMQKLKALGVKAPIVMTSKGIEQDTELLLSEVLQEVLGANYPLAVLSGPTIADEVMKMMPTSAVASAYDAALMAQVQTLFSTDIFRVYTNSDVLGVQFGGAMKNIIALACGISVGLGFGDNTRAALMTRGLHEIRRLAAVKGARSETLIGLSGMGDLCVTCLSTMSRNFRFGLLIGQGVSPEEAKKQVGAVVEGAYSCVSAMQLSRDHNIELPISETVYNVLYGGMKAIDSVKYLMLRAPKSEE